MRRDFKILKKIILKMNKKNKFFPYNITLNNNNK